MNNLNYKKTLAFFVSLAFFAPFLIFAQNTTGGGATIQNPLGDNNTSVQDILLKIMNLVAMVGEIVVVFFIIYSGFKFVTAKGNEGEVTKAKDIFFATVIGGAILLGADVIANVVVNTVNSTVGRN